ESQGAREALYWLLTTRPSSWIPRGELQRGLANREVPVNASMFRALQVLACDALVNAVTRRRPDGQLVRLPDQSARHIEQLLLRAIVHPHTPTEHRIRLLEAIQVLSEPGAAGDNRERAAEIPLRFCAGIANELLVLLQQPTIGTDQEQTREQRLRNSFA